MTTPGTSRFRAAAILAVSATLVVGATASAQARPANARPLAPNTHFTMADDGSTGLTAKGAQIPNIDSVKSTIRTYYNATDGIADKDESPYITEMKEIEDAQWAYLLDAQEQAITDGVTPAIVFDADDTTLWTYDMEDGAMGFNFDPTLQNQWVQDKLFPATPGMVKFVERAKRLGFAIYGITGRRAAQEVATVDNLSEQGYTAFDADNFFTKWDGADTNAPAYVDCTLDDNPTACSTVEYKAGTRQHIIDEDGVRIVLNVGDQWSDLQGGYAEKTLKLPNPTYYLPSPSISTAPPSDADLTPRTKFTMEADGSSGATEGGEGIPNIDSVKSTIRSYYNAVNGIADKGTSAYISELNAFTKSWAPKVRQSCHTVAKAHKKRPAVVFDADDTTLWTYDMEDGAMHFIFDPVLQDEWVQDERFPATPYMKRVVRAAQKGGCKVFGLTGRNDGQRKATISNLNTLYDGAFRPRFYYTKWTGTGASQQPGYIHCAAVKCTTIEYKSQTRKHIERNLGFRIVANFGDQFSDLIGGHADQAVKLPNPTYYLP
jgi:predicted secreted acid phosphatase